MPGYLGAPAARRALARLRFAAQAGSSVVACGPGPRGARGAVCRAGSKNANGATEAAPSVVRCLAAPPDYLPVGAVVGTAAPEPAAGAAAAAPEPEPAAAAGGATGGASTTGGAVGAGAAAEPEPAGASVGAGAAGQPASMAAEARTAADSERRKNDIVVTSRRKVPIARRAETESKSSCYGDGG